jgi:hypothetical protein
MLLLLLLMQLLLLPSASGQPPLRTGLDFFTLADFPEASMLSQAKKCNLGKRIEYS